MPAVRSLTAFGLILSIGLPGGTALAQSSWVDPPDRPAATRAPPNAAATKADAARPAPPRSEPSPPAASAAQGATPGATQAAAPEPALDETRPADRSAERSAAAERHRGHLAARRAERPRRAPHRLAETPPPSAPPATAAPAQPSARSGDWAGTAQGLAAEYFDAISAPGARMVSAAPHFYGDRIRFYGRTMSLPALLAEKRRFAERWPERRYAPRGMRTLCNGVLATCTVHTQVAFRAANPGRGAVSQGVAEVVLEVSLAGPRPAIVSESGRVLSRGANLSAVAQPAGGA